MAFFVMNSQKILRLLRHYWLYLYMCALQLCVYSLLSVEQRFEESFRQLY